LKNAHEQQGAVRRYPLVTREVWFLFLSSSPSMPPYGNLIDMGTPAMDTALDGLLDPLSRCLDAESARRVTEFRIDPAVQSRIDTLAERANNGVLTEEERAEYEAFINAGDFISILKLKARRHLDLNQS
jgi:hypothetical protein